MGTAPSGPFVPGKVDTQWTPLYSTKSFAAAAVVGAEKTFFDDVVGTAGIGPEITNMTRAFELEAPRQMLVHAMRVAFIDTDAADMIKFFKSYTTRLIVAGFTRLEAPPENWTAGAGLYNSGVQNGIPDARSVYTVASHPIRIPAGIGFSVKFVGTSVTVTAAATVRIYLDGPLSKPVG